MKHLYFVRHGQSQGNVDRVYTGAVETPLTELGLQQAHQAAHAAKQLTIDHIISSPLSRSLDTAKIIAEAIGYPTKQIEVDKLLVERDYGSLVGKPWASASELDMDHIPGVETVAAVLQRGQQVYDHLVSLPYDSILVASHGTLYRALVFAIHPEQALTDIAEPANAEIVQLI